VCARNRTEIKRGRRIFWPEDELGAWGVNGKLKEEDEVGRAGGFIHIFAASNPPRQACLLAAGTAAS
jgi:hypothetical protein